MKAKVIKTGEIIDVIPQTNPNAVSASDILYSSDYRTYKGWELDFINIEDKHIDWEQRRYEIAKAAMQGFCANPSGRIVLTSFTQFADWSLTCANALIEELKKRNN